MYPSAPAHAKILDLGCGTGEFLAELQRKGYEVWGVDSNIEKIAYARRRFPLVHLYAMAFEDFFEQEDVPQFNFVTFFEVLQYVEDPLWFIKCARNVLKPDGAIVLSVPSRDRFLVGVASSWDIPPNPLTRWNEEAIAYLFAKVDFKISSFAYLEQFSMLTGALNEKFLIGGVRKTAHMVKGSPNVWLLMKIVRFLANVKQYLIGGFLGFFLWMLGKILKKPNGTLFIELARKNL